jgi:putative mRNA 3-end processing factor
MLLQFNKNGIYCEQADIYIDPWRAVDYAIITHAHSDHARSGSRNYLAHHDSVGILKYRLGSHISIQSLGYNEVIVKNGVKISLHPAGHIIGSSQIRLEYQGEIWVVSGDYKIKADGICAPFDAVRCHHFITESTFGMPIYNFEATEITNEKLKKWCLANFEQKQSSILIGYSLGKAQRILKCLEGMDIPIVLHGAIYNTNAALGIDNSKYIRYDKDIKKNKNETMIIVAPPGAAETPWMKQFEPNALAICSGWMQLRGARRRSNADVGFAMSDHADWQGLNEAVLTTGAENIYVTHGYQNVFARWLSEQHGLNATTVETLYEGESLSGENKTNETAIEA